MRSKNTSLINLDNESVGIVGLIGGLLTPEFNEKITGIDKIPGGVNSEVFRILTDKNNEYFVKKYHRRKGDNRDRLSTEFSGLSFLWAQGIRNIPEPIKASGKSQIAVYRFINGEKVSTGEIKSTDVDQAADFANRLHSLVGTKGADTQPIASEACFSIQAYIDCVDSRADNLKRIIKKDIIFDPLSAYFENKFMPFWGSIKKEAARKAEKLGIDVNEKMRGGEKTLSASDFGFHNAIKAENGRLFFIDFEYYGWDDPVKMIADFYLQPAVPVPLSYRERFFEKVRKNYREGARLEKRLSIIYPILGLKWCLIMLNVFFRLNNGEKEKEICLSHLAKAASKLKETKQEMDTRVFPISLS
jgi:thiamine kinase-like enzyme